MVVTSGRVGVFFFSFLLFSNTELSILETLCINRGNAFGELIRIIRTIPKCVLKWVKEVDTSYIQLLPA